MDRLTYWKEEYGCWSYHCGSGEAANRLAAYEDTGLTPEEIEKLRGQNEQLREAAALVTKESAELLERRWIPVEERLPAPPEVK